jgi:hypothetical protein
MTFKVVKLLTIHEYATSSICHSEELCDEESLSPLETQLLVTLASFDYGVDAIRCLSPTRRRMTSVKTLHKNRVYKMRNPVSPAPRPPLLSPPALFHCRDDQSIIGLFPIQHPMLVDTIEELLALKF